MYAKISSQRSLLLTEQTRYKRAICRTLIKTLILYKKTQIKREIGSIPMKMTTLNQQVFHIKSVSR